MMTVTNLFTGEEMASVEPSTAMDFISTLKTAHRAQAQWAQLEPEQRALALVSVGQWMLSNQDLIARKLSQVQGLSESFILQQEVLPGIESFLQIQQSLNRLEEQRRAHFEFSPWPLGLITILLPQYFSFRFLAEKISEGLLAGNAFFVKTSRVNPIVGEIFKEALHSLPENLVSIFHGEHELGQIMASHPAVKGVIVAGKPSSMESFSRMLVGSWKRVQFFSGYHNSALILPDAGDFHSWIPSLLESCFRGMGQMSWNIQNILVLESSLPEFEKAFGQAVEGLAFARNENDQELLGPLHPRKKAHIENLWKQIKSENGKILCSGEISEKGPLQVRPLVIKDLSHCSTLQQDWLGAPVVLISPVKYVHEMVKWANTSYFGQLAQIFGSLEKRQKWGRQLEVGAVVGPGGISDLKKWPVGVKQSSLGEMDPWAFGRFFSQFRVISKSEI